MNTKIPFGKAVDGKRVFLYVGRALERYRMAAHPRKYVQTKGPTKTFQHNGHWIEKTSVTPILLCVCGNRYLKTRHGQTKCLRCTSQAAK